jgi:hypothetical protein
MPFFENMNRRLGTSDAENIFKKKKVDLFLIKSASQSS